MLRWLSLHRLPYGFDVVSVEAHAVPCALCYLVFFVGVGVSASLDAKRHRHLRANRHRGEFAQMLLTKIKRQIILVEIATAAIFSAV